MRRTGWICVVALVACGPILGVEEITIVEGGVGEDGGTSPRDASALPGDAALDGPSETCGAGAERACGEPAAGLGLPCKAGKQTCGSDGTWGPCIGAVGPREESCDDQDLDCNGVPGIDEPAPPPPPGTKNCTRIFKCDKPGRGALFFRTGVGFTNVAGPDTVWTAFAPRGDFSDNTFPPGHVRISREGNSLGPVSVKSDCCPAATGCATQNVLFDGNGQYYTLPPP